MTFYRRLPAAGTPPTTDFAVVWAVLFDDPDPRNLPLRPIPLCVFLAPYLGCSGSVAGPGLGAGFMAGSGPSRSANGARTAQTDLRVLTLCYAIVLPGRKSGFRAGFRPDYIRESLKIGPPAGRRPVGGLPGRKSSIFVVQTASSPSAKLGGKGGGASLPHLFHWVLR